MSVSHTIRARGIEEVLHFTTSNGLIGVMSTGLLLSHARLPAERQLSHILQVNCPDRSRDQDWHGYVNLSISRINASFFDIAKNKWHATKDLYWCVLSFDPEILAHEGVVFSTTNNAYADTKRQTGISGFDTLFGPTIKQFPNKIIQRGTNLAQNLTTCRQAEALYPVEVPIRYLQRVYVPTEDIYCEAEAQIEVCAPALKEDFQLIVAPEKFE